MTQIAYRATLSNAMWPQRASRVSSTVVSPQYESLSSRKAELPPSEERDIIAPQVYYVENVLPTSYGFDSVGYVPVAPEPLALEAGEVLINTAKASSTSLPQVHFALTSAGSLYIMAPNLHVWKKSIHSFVVTADSFVTAASMNDKIIVAVSDASTLYLYDAVTNEITFGGMGTPGLEDVDIQGVFSTTNYLAVWDADTIYWSAFENPLDFVPSEITGAGNGIIMAGRGRIRACVPTTLGFIIYCEQNAIAALSTARSDEPFTLREISASGGISHIRQVVPDWNSNSHYAYTTSGLQQITNTDAKPFVAELTDLIQGQVIDYLDSAGQLITEEWPLGVTTSVALVLDRYLCVSYKEQSAVEYQWCYVYDTWLRRAGRLKISHSQIIDYYNNLAAVSRRGAVNVLRRSGLAGNFGLGRIALGKYQHIRQRMLVIDSVDVDKMFGTALCSVRSSLDGFTDSSVSTGHKTGARWYFSNVGTNHTVHLRGDFSLNTIVLHYHIHGRS